MLKCTAPPVKSALTWPPQLEVILALPLNSCRICSPFSSDGILTFTAWHIQSSFHMFLSVFNKQIIQFLRLGRLPSFVLSFSALHLSADGKQAKHAGRHLQSSLRPEEVHLWPRTLLGKGILFPSCRQWIHLPSESQIKDSWWVIQTNNPRLVGSSCLTATGGSCTQKDSHCGFPLPTASSLQKEET